jgi:hypothetical protein
MVVARKEDVRVSSKKGLRQMPIPGEEGAMRNNWKNAEQERTNNV